MTDPNAQPPVDPGAGQPQQPAAPPQQPVNQPPAAPQQPQYTQPPAAPQQPQYTQAPAAPQQQYNQPPAPPAAPAAPQQPYGQSAEPAAPLTQQQDKSYAMWAHLGGVISFLAFFTGWLALLAIVPSLVIYLAFGKRGQLAKQESKAALNFQITMVGAMIIWAIIAAIITVAVLFSTGYGYGIWALVLLLLAIVGWALVVIDVVFSIVGAMRVNRGGSYRYPFSLHFIK